MVASKPFRNFGNKGHNNKSSEKGSEQKFRFKCHNCKKVGHMAKDCKTQRHENNKKPEGKETSKRAEITMRIEAATQVETTMTAKSELKNIWCLDSGASSHMCPYEEKFEDIGKTNTCKLNLASSESILIEGIGSVKMKMNEDSTVNLKKTLFVPDLRSNLLSVAKITDNGYDIYFRKENAVVVNPKTGKEIFTAKRKEDLYYVDEKTEKANISQAIIFRNGTKNLVT